ncbi:uncharacterized protein BKCO1_7100010 [Diplodia corticola]|uniref:Uncharacterized protein n=1 Tax=Diplodia corticola TaxID=236234 RepID=A0A1J9RQL5_9PEZI|nr:uncharacterized protein BKCO1_7100010 [Diplodia corticola]OJD29845.1 hypothetical protein BKCO1_7100010 [Diplodia corticola]
MEQQNRDYAAALPGAPSGLAPQNNQPNSNIGPQALNAVVMGHGPPPSQQTYFQAASFSGNPPVIAGTHVQTQQPSTLAPTTNPMGLQASTFAPGNSQPQAFPIPSANRATPRAHAPNQERRLQRRATPPDE